MSADPLHDFLTRAMAWQDGALTPDEIRAFEEELLASAEKRQVFAEIQVRSLQVHELLRRDAYQSAQDSGPEAQVIPFPAPVRPWWRRPGLLTSAAAVIAAGAFALLRQPDSEGGTPPLVGSDAPPLATLTYSSAAEWEEGHAPQESALPAGTYSLTAGTVRMSLTHDGTVASLAAPATFDLVAPGNIRLHEGRLSAHVSQPDAGFTVLTDALTVLDRGTVFGVEVDSDGQALVSVLEGKVDVHPPGVSAMQRIEQGDSVTARPDRQEVLPGPDTITGFNDLWPLTLGVDQLSHLVEFIPPSRRLRWGSYRDDSRLFLLAERHSLTLTEPVTADLAPALTPKMRKDGMKPKRPFTVSAGTRVSTYLLFFRPQEGARERGIPGGLSGVITFARPVLGIITDSTRLEASDAALGLSGLVYKDSHRRGLEKKPHAAQRDILRISPDGRHVYFNLHSIADSDQFRVLVKAP